VDIRRGLKRTVLVVAVAVSVLMGTPWAASAAGPLFVQGQSCSRPLGGEQAQVCVTAFHETIPTPQEPCTWCIQGSLTSPAVPAFISHITLVVYQCSGTTCSPVSATHGNWTVGVEQSPGHTYVARASWIDDASNESFVAVSSGSIAVPCPC
jgi:hypothetical protein